MDALRLLVTPQSSRLVIDLPEHFAQGPCEVIVLPAQEPAGSLPLPGNPPVPRRRPSPLLTGTRLQDDLITPVLPADAWSAIE